MSNDVCPLWMGYMLISPLRRMMQNPDEILSNHVTLNMKVMDIGSAMGFFSLPMAKLVGSKGKVFCIDLQEKMIKALIKRAKKASLENRIESRICTFNSLMVDDIKEEVDFALAFAVIHEVSDKERLFGEIMNVLKPNGRLLIAEPIGHVSAADFEDTLCLAQKIGFNLIDTPKIPHSKSVLLTKQID